MSNICQQYTSALRLWLPFVYFICSLLSVTHTPPPQPGGPEGAGKLSGVSLPGFPAVDKDIMIRASPGTPPVDVDMYNGGGGGGGGKKSSFDRVVEKLIPMYPSYNRYVYI